MKRTFRVILCLLLPAGAITARAAAPTSYEEWRGQSFSTSEITDATISGPLADPEGDGLRNLAEYALGTEPKVADAPSATRLDSTARSIVFKRRSQVGDVSYTVETSTDLVTWKSGVDRTGPSTTTPLDPEWDSVTVPSLTALSSPTRHFLRLRISTPIWLRTCHGSGGQNYLYVGVSLDGKTFTGIGKRILYGSWPATGSQVRDPSVIFYDGTFVVAYTGDHFGQVPWFGMAKSTNLLDWTQLPNVTPTGFSGSVNNIWAPEWLVDNGRYYLVFRISTVAGNFYGTPGMGYTECLDPGTWSSWTPWQSLGGIPSNWNDVCIVKSGSTYHLFANNGSGDIVHATSQQPFSGYGAGTIISTPWRTAIGPTYNAVEGPNAVALGGDRFRIYFQHLYTDIGYYAESSDNMATWGDITQIGWDGGGENPGHGTVIKLDSPTEQDLARPFLPAMN